MVLRMKKQISQTDKHLRRTCGFDLGYTLVELMIAVVIVLIVAGIAVPNIMNFIHMAKLRGAAADYSSLLQVGRIRSVQDDRFYSVYFLAGAPTQAYVDLKSNGGTAVDAGDPLIAMPSEVVISAAGSAPDTTNLKGQFLPAGSTLVVKDGSTAGTPVIFGPRGLPCTSQTATGGTVCTSSGGATAFWVFFNNTISGAWEAVTLTPAGRIQKWQHGTGGWSSL
jgi:prepilin-type N-terminal cleavage/methylation domain-containing protein